MEFRDFVEGKRWEANREDVVRLWNTLRPYLPMQVTPIPVQHTGTRYDDDGIRITGSPSFINSVLSRVKDFLRYESQPGLELDISYKQIQNKHGTLYGGQRFVCYIHVLQKKPEPIKIEKPKPPKID
jgi:hypothetical protein